MESEIEIDTMQKNPHGKRTWSDPQVYTHVAFLPAVWIALCRDPPMLDLVFIQGPVIFLSLWWHKNHEHECTLATIEHAFAHALFVYGTVQTLYSPAIWILFVNIVCLCATLTVYVATNLRRELWEIWHPIGTHVIPGVWSAVIASYHESLFDLLDVE